MPANSLRLIDAYPRFRPLASSARADIAGIHLRALTPEQLAGVEVSEGISLPGEKIMKSIVILDNKLSRFCGRCPKCKKPIQVEAASYYFAAPCSCGVTLSTTQCNPAQKIYFGNFKPLTHKQVSEPHQCDARCMHAIGANCECSCGGKNHGAGNSMVTVAD